ncbi:MAG TPA: type II secretion system protein [Candidatus Saccharimonadales bacterium]|nr:type II secretion system protein [Candidatus Saccharimonadales bacterium]
MKTKTKIKNLNLEGGFTLIELLVVIGILAILLAITLIAINPNKHFEDTRNTQRSSNVSEVLNAIYEYESANNGNAPGTLSNVTTSAKHIAAQANETPDDTSFAAGAVTFLDLTGNTITSGNVTVTSCTNSGNNGTFPITAGDATSITVTNASGVASDATCVLGTFTAVVNPCSDLVPTYIADIPKDPTTGVGTVCTGTFDTGYTIQATSGRYTIVAPAAEDGATISVTR